jgi:periplasmic protein TonB
MKRFPCRALLALTVTACLLGGASAWAQQPTAPVPSIEELKRQLEAKRQEAKRQLEAKQQPKAKPQPEVKPQPEAAPELEGKAQPETKPPSEAEPQPAAKPLQGKQPLKPKQPPTKVIPGEPESGTPALVASAEKQAPPSDVIKAPPPAKNISPVKLEPNSAAAADSCPYPAAARDRGDTGTVVLLIYVAPDGRAVDTQVESSSGSEVLDEAAEGCVKEFGHFVPKRVGPRAEAGWFRMRYKWSFGD